MNTVNVLLPVVGYLFGAIPFGLIIGRCVGVDVRSQGSRNIGATNVSRVIGKRWGIVTLFCDCMKGLLPVLLAAGVLPAGGDSALCIALTGVMAVVGHMFSCYLRFSGGKGVATGLGVFLFLSPAAVGVSLGVFIAVVAVSGFVSAGSLLASALLPLWLFFLGAAKVYIYAGVGIAALIWIKHHENIARLLKGEEKSWRKKV